MHYWPARIERTGPAMPRLAVRIEEGSRLFLASGDALLPTTLDEIVAHATALDPDNRERLRSVGVRLDVHPHVPWQHVGFVMEALAEKWIGRIELRLDELALWLLAHPGPRAAIRRVPPEDRLYVRIARTESVSFRVQREVTYDFKRAERLIRGAQAPIAILKAGAAVPAKWPIRILAALLQSRVPEVNYSLLTRLPEPEDRTAHELAAPREYPDL